jgi:UDPglucose--hexose-1-phosphate uridylyltransferase
VPELRTDWLTGRAVLVAENRAQRPNEFAGQLAPATGAQAVANLALAEVGLPDLPGLPTCPFCAGNESRTPPAVFERRDTAGRWQVRVVPNRYPAVVPDPVAAGGPPAEAAAGEPPAATPALGAHEVIIESARHIDRTSALSAAELQHVLETYAHRLRFWRDDGRFRYGLVFKNQGPRAGASIAHLHSQFIALPQVPPLVDAEQRRAAQDYQQHGSCSYCRLIGREKAWGERLVLDRHGYVAFCPFASLQPHEVWLLPERHEPSFENGVRHGAAERLADVLHALLERVERNVPDAAYNLLLRTAAWGAHCDDWSHWRIELLPRANPLAGFEIATAVHINPVPPEAAARQLRSH